MSSLVKEEEENESFIIADLYKLVIHGRSTELDQYFHKNLYIRRFLTHAFVQNKIRCNLLMLAALNGHDEVVRLILSHCHDNIEVGKLVEYKGCVRSISGVFVENVTALWCALDRSHYNVARTLIHLGNATVCHGPLHPLLIDAIPRNRFDSVYFLIENGYVDVNQTFFNDESRYTSLLLAVQNKNTQMIKYLISRGANIEYTTNFKKNTPLIYAVKTGHLESIELLCLSGADPNRRNYQGITALILAARNHQSDVIDVLLNSNYEEKGLNDLELVASSYMISNNNVTPAEIEWVVHLLRRSLQQRKILNLKKKISQPIIAYDLKQECQSIDELDLIQYDIDRLLIEALLIRERILLPENNSTLFPPLIERGKNLVSQSQYDHCLHLWFHCFYLQQQMKINTDIQPFIWLFCKMIIDNIDIPVDNFLQVSCLTLESLKMKLNDSHIKNTLFLIAIAAKFLEKETINLAIRRSIIEWIKQLCHLKLTTTSGKTLLHLSVDQRMKFHIHDRWADIRLVVTFPNLSIIQLLLYYGIEWIDLNAIDQIQGDTILHIISRQFTDDNLKSIMQLIINAGAHPDCINMYGQTPFDEAKNNEIQTLLQYSVTPLKLKCLCARLINNYQLPYEYFWPDQAPLNTFLRLHGALKNEYFVEDDNNSLNYFDHYDTDDFMSD